ncbi:MAG: HEPN domain-containing protein [Bacteroidaceae bacterium]|nr:HEPN domain-containing protein [Bacteroidaceae bacterium]
MKEQLDEHSKKELIKYRIERAEQTIEESKLLANSSYYNASINRLYYACYYAASALLLKNNIQANTHAGVKMMLGLHFISKGTLSKELGKTFNTLFEKRHSNDYDDFVYCDQDTFNELFPQAKDFVKALKEKVL